MPLSDILILLQNKMLSLTQAFPFPSKRFLQRPNKTYRDSSQPTIPTRRLLELREGPYIKEDPSNLMNREGKISRLGSGK